MLISEARRSEIVARVLSGESVRRVAVNLDLPLSTVYYHARSVCVHQTSFDLVVLNDKERGYLLGIYVGDGSLIRDKARGEFLVKIALDKTRDCDISEFIKSIFKRAGKLVTVTPWREMTTLRIWSKSFYDFIRTYVRLQRRALSNRHTKILLDHEKWGRDFAIGFLGGLIDSDGYVVRSENGGHYGARITTSSVSLRNQLRRICHDLGVATSLHVDDRGTPDIRPRYIVSITSASMHSVCSEILCVKHQRFHGGPGRT